MFGNNITIYQAEDQYCVKVRGKDDAIGQPYRPTTELLDASALFDAFKVNLMWDDSEKLWIATCRRESTNHAAVHKTWMVAVVQAVLLFNFPEGKIIVPQLGS